MTVNIEVNQDIEEHLATTKGESNFIDEAAEQTYKNDDALVAERASNEATTKEEINTSNKAKTNNVDAIEEVNTSNEVKPNDVDAKEEINTSNEAKPNDVDEKINILNEAERLYEDDKLLEAARLLSTVDQKDLKEKHKEILRKAKGLCFEKYSVQDFSILSHFGAFLTSWRRFSDRPKNKSR